MIDGDESKKQHSDASSQIFGIIKTVCSLNKHLTGEIEAIERRILARGYSVEELEKTLENYQNLNVLMVREGTVTLLS